MPWHQTANPLNNSILSALVALIPILVIFWALIIRKMKGHWASVLALITSVCVAVLFYSMPVKLALLSASHGILYGLFPICWIVITVIYLFNITVKSGQFEIIKQSMASITNDRRLQALLIAFSFGAFLEGTAGFGTPVAISAALLMGLGFEPFYAAGICLIANTAPVAFGAIGIPVTVASQVSGIPEMALSQMIGRTLPFISFIIPFYLVVLMSGFRHTIDVLPAIFVSGFSFALLQWYSSNYLGAALPDILSSIGSIVALVILLRFWQPKHVWRFKNEKPFESEAVTRYSSGQVFRAWLPFLTLTFFIIVWGLPSVKAFLDAMGTIRFKIPGLDNQIIGVDGHLIPHVVTLNFLSAAGTAIFISALLTIPITGIKFKTGIGLFFETLRQLRYPIVTIGAILGLAYLVNDSGIIMSIAYALSETGMLYPLFAPVLGWLGVFITGSDTSSNALFSKLQYATAKSIGVDPIVTVAANSSGGVVGKMISPQSIAVATAAVGLIGKESSLFKFTIKHSLILISVICVIVFAQAYFLKSFVPAYQDGAKMKTTVVVPPMEKPCTM